MKYLVSISRTVSETKQYEVEAENGFQAADKAAQQAANDSFNNPGSPDYQCEGVIELPPAKHIQINFKL